MNSTEVTRIIEVPIGDDIVLAQALAASLSAEGIETELVLSSDPYVGLEHTSPHCLMIRESDAEIVRPIVAAHLHHASMQNSLNEEPSGRRPRGTRDVIAFVLLVMFAGGPVAGLVWIVREVLSSF